MSTAERTAADEVERLKKRYREAMDHTIALHRSIELHCRGRVIPEDIGRLCPHMASILNADLRTNDRAASCVADALQEIERESHRLMQRARDARISLDDIPQPQESERENER